LQKSIQYYKQENYLFPFFDNNRIFVIEGDLDDPNLGLSKDLFSKLGNEIDVIYHNGCLVNTKFPYLLVKRANVLSTLGKIYFFSYCFYY
jgi:thioester reductase-like protein